MSGRRAWPKPPEPSKPALLRADPEPESARLSPEPSKPAVLRADPEPESVRLFSEPSAVMLRALANTVPSVSTAVPTAVPSVAPTIAPEPEPTRSVLLRAVDSAPAWLWIVLAVQGVMFLGMLLVVWQQQHTTRELIKALVSRSS